MQALFEVTGRRDRRLIEAVEAIRADLAEHGALDARTTLLVALIERLADAVDAGFSAPKVSVASAQLARQLMDAIELLPETETATGTVYDALPDIVRRLTIEAVS